MYEYPKDNRIKSPKGKAKGEKEMSPSRKMTIGNQYYIRSQRTGI